MWECYNEETNSCDRRCQGCSDCPIAQGLNPSRKTMRKYIEESIEEQKEFDLILKELENDRDFMDEMKQILKIT